jgi:hypothetical protein
MKIAIELARRAIYICPTAAIKKLERKIRMYKQPASAYGALA